MKFISEEFDMKEFQARQGDIFFRSCKKPDIERLKRKDDNVLAFGEVTGHSHCVKSHRPGAYESYVDENGDIYMLSTDAGIEVGHDEHDTITIPKGEWVCVTRQREYDPVSEERERRVRD